ncbi:dynamin family protein [Actinobaculum suis]|uniref:dynamin family protein n=1 Tax=Actinobaculum suis TaxID=1657 RepID=UPI000809BBC6|nr:dynamin family protein [Actinobaculum suis]
MALSLPNGLSYLDRALELGGRYLSAEVRQQGEAVLAKAQERGTIGTSRTIIAFAGATGSGKSSLINALVGQEVVKVSPIRPATHEPVVVSGDHAPEIGDWLGVSNRKIVMQLSTAPLSDLVLVDLPDLDSSHLEHREIANRIIARADVIIWVVDPQKYADAVIHEDYLRPLAELGRASAVVLNHADSVPEVERAEIVQHLRELLAADGLAAPILVTSAVQGHGIGQLRGFLREAAASKRASAERIAGDIRTVGGAISADIEEAGGTEVAEVEPDSRPLAAAVARAAGAEEVTRAAAKSYTQRSALATGWPLTRFRLRHRVDPLEAIGLRSGTARFAGGSAPSIATSTTAEGSTVPAVASTGNTGTSAEAVETGTGAETISTGGAETTPALAPSTRTEHTVEPVAQGWEDHAPETGNTPAGNAETGSTENLENTAPEPGNAETAILETGASKTGVPEDGSRKVAAPESAVPNLAGGVVSLALSPVEAGRAELELRRYAEAVSEPLPLRWRNSVRERVAASGADLADLGARIVTTTDTEADRRPFRWTVGAILQWIGVLALVLGLAWVIVRALGALFGFGLGPAPSLGSLPWPFVLVVGGGLLGLVVSALARVLRHDNAEALARRVRERIMQRVEEQTRKSFCAPLLQERKNYAEFRQAAESLRTVTV